MNRCDQWEPKLAAFIASRRRMPFEWGRNDCCMFAADWVLELTGIDLAESFRGLYATRDEAMSVLANSGGVVTIVHRAFAGHGIEPVKGCMAFRGDIVLLQTDLGDMLGVCAGSTSIHPGQDGIVFAPMGFAQKAWRIT